MYRAHRAISLLSCYMLQAKTTYVPLVNAVRRKLCIAINQMNTKPFADVTLLLARVLVSLLMLHHGIEKLSDVDGFTSFIVDNYFSYLPFDHSYWTRLAAYTQIFGSFFLIIGIFTRASLLGLSSTMLFALVFHFSDTGLQGAPLGIVDAHNYEFEASSLYLLLYALMLVFGSGGYSLIAAVRSKISDSILRWIV